jgi:hypothetical protein
LFAKQAKNFNQRLTIYAKDFLLLIEIQEEIREGEKVRKEEGKKKTLLHRAFSFLPFSTQLSKR